VEDGVKAQVGRWGNSLALRLPRDIVEELQVREGTTVELEVEGRVLRVAPAKPRYALADLVKRITPDNIPDEIFDDRPKGREAL
jgi:antitoxin MazE